MNVEPLTPPGPLGNNTTLGSDSPCFHDNDSFKYNAYTVTYLLVFPVALFFNVGAMLVFLVQLRHKYSASSVVMMNLALSDGSFALTLPLRLAYYFRGGVWDFPDWLCRLCVFGFYVNLYTSILFLTLLSVLRWLAVDKPLHHRSVATPKRVFLVCLGIWAFVGVASTPFLSNGVIHRGGSPRCFEPSSHSSWGRVLILNYVGLVFGFLLPFFTILRCYSRVVRHLSGSDGPRGTGTARRRRRRAVQLVSMVISTFLLCFLPYHVVRTLHLHAVCGRWACELKVALQRGVSITLCMAALNSVVDPLLYYYSTSSFRDTARAAHTRLRLSSRGSSLRRSRAADERL